MAYLRLTKLKNGLRYPHLDGNSIIGCWDVADPDALYPKPPKSEFKQRKIDKILIIVYGRIFHASADADVGTENDEQVAYIDEAVYEGLF